MKIPKKQRLSVYLDPDIMKALAAYAARRDQSRSLVAEAAIASFLSPDAAERQEAATTKRLDQLDRRMTRMERDLGISVEMLAVRGSHKAGRRMTSTLVSGGLRSRTARGAGWAPRAPGITPPARSVGASIHQTAGSGDWC